MYLIIIVLFWQLDLSHEIRIVDLRWYQVKLNVDGREFAQYRHVLLHRKRRVDRSQLVDSCKYYNLYIFIYMNMQCIVN